MACSSSLPLNVFSDRQKMIKELVQGSENTNRLRTLLSQSAGVDHRSVITSAESLVSRIMESFTNALLMLNRNPNEAVVSQSQLAANSHTDSPCFDGQKYENPEESHRTSVSTTLEDRQGCYKKRKTIYTRQKETSTLIDDGRAWRKYGQKAIHKAKHPRNYYRCTNKFDQGCQATKQVQKIQDNPPIYRTTYYGHHTCKDLPRASELVMDCTSPDQDSSALVSFTNPNLNLTSKQTHPFFSAFTSTSKHEEFKDVILLPELKNNNNMIVAAADRENQSSSLDYIGSLDQFYDQHDYNDDLKALFDDQYYDQNDHHNNDDSKAFDQFSGNMALLSPLDFDIQWDLMSGLMCFDDINVF